MSSFDRTKRRLFFAVATIGVFIILANLLVLSGTDVRSQIDKIPIPGKQRKPPAPITSHTSLGSGSSWSEENNYDNFREPSDAHPIARLMKEADEKWLEYEESRSTTFRGTVNKYRRKYGRHPPPGFKDWYQYARARNVHNVDDFEQIMDDLRPFWAVEPQVIRNLSALMWRKPEDGIAGIHIREHKVVKESNPSWRSATMVTLIEKFIKYLPDMDIAMNRLDQPRVVVPWKDMQSLLAKELETRTTPPESLDEYTAGMTGYLNLSLTDETPPMEDPGWYPAHGKQYMDIAKTACPPESHARNTNSTPKGAEELYKDSLGGVITNFNRSSDLCTVGPEIQNQHGFLFSSSSVIATKRLVPVFGECKVNINSDILFPANMYWKHDDRYDYSKKQDVNWEDKKDAMVWRGVTSGGVQIETNWRTMHRQRLVMLVNSTEMQGREVRILTEQTGNKGEYENFRQFQPSKFAEDYTDVGFTETWGCVPANCDFYNDVWTLKPQMPLPDQFKYKFLVDVDGHSFSGRWRAFLESKSLGIKATIFREWHDSRLFAWRHFVPMDNRFDDMYSILTYFIGVGEPGNQRTPEENYANGDAYVAKHDFEGKRIARQGREWANKVLRRDDIEVYMFRLLLEYARIIDDNRAHIGYSGDGSELDKYDVTRRMVE